MKSFQADCLNIQIIWTKKDQPLALRTNPRLWENTEETTPPRPPPPTPNGWQCWDGMKNDFLVSFGPCLGNSKRVPSHFSRVQLCDPMGHSPPGFSVRGISQARVLEWVAISSSRGSSPPKGWTCVWLLHWQTDSSPREPPGQPSDVCIFINKNGILTTLPHPLDGYFQREGERKKIKCWWRYGEIGTLCSVSRNAQY